MNQVTQQKELRQELSRIENYLSLLAKHGATRENSIGYKKYDDMAMEITSILINIK
ncbi:MAG: hypothetical protein Unbinned5607contig1000_17 [Prokaryotic dsDNA virus sp.]|nr:MAG: hypothetical protein Unbinned5607contig1000_17 [Prokaryotic dsDNA virus sp.]|tara:strand:+ start:1270 stop:1437 length:168 start_codon:yes stop_codon:yes gene_type:complete